MTLSWFFWLRENNPQPQAAADKLRDERENPAKPAVRAHVLQALQARCPLWRAWRKHQLDGFDTTTMCGNHRVQIVTLGDSLR